MVVLEGEEYLTVTEACARLGVKPATLYAYASRGIIASYKQGIRRQRLYKKADVDALLDLRPSATPPAKPAPTPLPHAASWIDHV